MKYILPALAIIGGLAIGVTGIVHGEADDSPGLQLLGVLFILVVAALAVRSARRSG